MTADLTQRPAQHMLGWCMLTTGDLMCYHDHEVLAAKTVDNTVLPWALATASASQAGFAGSVDWRVYSLLSSAGATIGACGSADRMGLRGLADDVSLLSLTVVTLALTRLHLHHLSLKGRVTERWCVSMCAFKVQCYSQTMRSLPPFMSGLLLSLCADIA